MIDNHSYFLLPSSCIVFSNHRFFKLTHMLLLREQTNFDAAVEPLDICKQRTGGAKKFGRAVYGEHLVSKVQTNFVY